MRDRLLQSLKWIWILVGALILLNPGHARAATNPDKKKEKKSFSKGKEFPIFDGRVYNGLFYPKIDIIEWSNKPEEPSHMQFQVYSKSKPVDMSFQLDENSPRKAMMVRYHLKDRNEYVCRRVLAPGHFNGQTFFIYKDLSDKDMDNTIVSMSEMPLKKGMTRIKPEAYAPCKEDEEEEKNIAKDGDSEEEEPGEEKNLAPAAVDAKRGKSSGGAIKSEKESVPFGDW